MMVYKNQDLLRASIMSASNSYRLGANEAPPAILSCFLGSQLSATLDEIVRQVGNEKMTPEEKTTLKLGIGQYPGNPAEYYRPQPYFSFCLHRKPL